MPPKPTSIRLTFIAGPHWSTSADRSGIKKDKKSLRIRVDDEGGGFDYKNIPDPTAPENIQNINGRGIFLMEKLSDGLEYSRNGATVELEFNLK